jgi:hypothetical protein
VNFYRQNNPLTDADVDSIQKSLEKVDAVLNVLKEKGDSLSSEEQHLLDARNQAARSATGPRPTACAKNYSPKISSSKIRPKARPGSGKSEDFLLWHADTKILRLIKGECYYLSVRISANETVAVPTLPMATPEARLAASAAAFQLRVRLKTAVKTAIKVSPAR